MINDVSKLSIGSNLFDSPSAIKKDASSFLENKTQSKNDFKSKIDTQINSAAKKSDSKLETKQESKTKNNYEERVPISGRGRVQNDKIRNSEIVSDDSIEGDDSDDTLPSQSLPDMPKTAKYSQSQQAAGTQPKDFSNKDGIVFEANEIKSRERIQSSMDERIPVIKFMQFMKEQYNINPQDIVNAMNSLSQDQLMATPQESMYAFFNKLGITNENIAPAKEQYLNMLSDLNKIENIKQTNNIKVEILDPKKEKLLELNRKLDQMNASFFIQPNARETQTTPLSAKAEGLENKLSPDKFFIDDKNTKSYLKQESVAENSPPTTSSVTYKPQQIEIPQVEVLNEQQTPVASTQDGMDPQQLKDLAKQNELKLDIIQLNNQLNHLEKSMQNSNAKSEDSEKNLDDANFFGFSHDKQVESKPAQFANELKLTDRSNNQSENIKTILNQAQVMIKKGGGEMKIQLQPEGIGNVNLKVKVEEGGRVGIQMVADTADAKRLLEGSLNDLKSHLAQHKMSVDVFKVDVSDKFNDTLNQQNDLNREEARNFLGQYREQMEQFRNPFHNDNPGLRIYRNYGGKAPETRPLEPMAVAPRKNNNGRLHLVA